MTTLLVSLFLPVLAAAGGQVSQVTVRAGAPIATVPPGLYSVGYNGWGDTSAPQAVAELNALGVKFCRLEVNLKDFCGDKPGDYRWDYKTPPDLGVGFVARVRQLIANGWTPLLSLSTSFALPSWFHGEVRDPSKGPTWLTFRGQPAAMTRIARDLAAGLAARGLKGLYYETIYELGVQMPLAEIHHIVALGLREGDPTCHIVGPATWPGWSVEERFVKPYLRKYGPDLLDVVSVHWYADNEHSFWALPGWKQTRGIVTMADHTMLEYLMETAPKYAAWCRSLRALLDDPAVNPTRKHIGIAFTEFDALATSPYGRNPENPDWPKYDPAADCYINTNYFGGVWSAYVLCDVAASGCAEAMFKFNARDFYGLIENGKGHDFYRLPVWFAWKLLRDEGGLVPGAKMLTTDVKGPMDQAHAHVGGQDEPWVGAFAVRAEDGLRLIVINRSQAAQTVEVKVAGLPAGKWKATRYLYCEGRVAEFIGRKPGTKTEGAFAGAPGDSKSEACLKPLDTIALSDPLSLPPLSMTILRLL